MRYEEWVGFIFERGCGRGGEKRVSVERIVCVKG